MPSQRTLMLIGAGLLIAFALSAIARQFVGQERCAGFGQDFVPGKGCVARPVGD